MLLVAIRSACRPPELGLHLSYTFRYSGIPTTTSFGGPALRSNHHHANCSYCRYDVSARAFHEFPHRRWPLIIGCVWTRPSNPNHERLSQASGPYKIFARGAQLLIPYPPRGPCGQPQGRRCWETQPHVEAPRGKSDIAGAAAQEDRSPKLRAAATHHPGRQPDCGDRQSVL